jgi:hypothetical protein
MLHPCAGRGKWTPGRHSISGGDGAGRRRAGGGGGGAPLRAYVDVVDTHEALRGVLGQHGGHKRGGRKFCPARVIQRARDKVAARRLGQEVALEWDHVHPRLQHRAEVKLRLRARDQGEDPVQVAQVLQQQLPDARPLHLEHDGRAGRAQHAAVHLRDAGAGDGCGRVEAVEDFVHVAAAELRAHRRGHDRRRHRGGTVQAAVEDGQVLVRKDVGPRGAVLRELEPQRAALYRDLNDAARAASVRARPAPPLDRVIAGVRRAAQATAEGKQALRRLDEEVDDGCAVPDVQAPGEQAEARHGARPTSRRAPHSAQL